MKRSTTTLGQETNMNTRMPQGKWYGNGSAQPLTQLDQFVSKLGTYVEQRRAEAGGASVFRCHPGLRTIAITDAIAGQFFINAPVTLLEREQHARFGGLKLRLHTYDLQLPTLVDSGQSHTASRNMLQAVMVQRSHLLAGAIESTFAQFSERWQQQDAIVLRNELELLSVSVLWQWLLDVVPPPHALQLWQQGAIGFETDSAYAQLLAKQRMDNVSAEAREAAETLLDCVRNSSTWQLWQNSAANHSVPLDQLGHLCVFACSFNGIAAGRSLFPTIIKLTQEATLRCELTEALTQLSPTALLQLDKHPFVEATMLEATRLFTRPRFVVKVAQQAFDLPVGDGASYAIATGERLMAIMPYIHRAPDVFAQPACFDPSRFMRNPKVAERVFGYLMSSTAQNSYGCAAYASRLAPMLWKSLLYHLMTDLNLCLLSKPQFGINELFDVGPSNLQVVATA